MSVQGRVQYDTVPWGGQNLVPVQVIASELITLLPQRMARRQRKAGTVGILSVAEWNEIQSIKGSGFNMDPGYIR